MVARFIWFYVKTLLAIAISLAFAVLVLGWQYGFQSLLRSDLRSDMIMGLILFPVVAMLATIAHFVVERRKE